VKCAILVAGPGLLHSRALVADVGFNSFAPVEVVFAQLGLALPRFRHVDDVPFAGLWIELDNVLDQFWQ
jgi:hypothetical protein